MPKYQEEQERHGKKSKPKKYPKSNHKHEYIDVIVRYCKGSRWYSGYGHDDAVSKVCRICGHIYDSFFYPFPTEEQYKELPLYECSTKENFVDAKVVEE